MNCFPEGQRIKLLHVVPTYLPATRYGGPIHSVHGLCKALAVKETEVEVYTTNVDGPGTSAVPLGKPVERDGVHITYFPTGHLRRIYRSPDMGAHLARRIAEFDLVHIHAMFLWPGLAASRTALASDVPYVVSPRGMLVRELIANKNRLVKTAWLQLFDRKMLRKAAAVHVTSRREAEDLNTLGIDAPRVITVPNGIEAPDFSAAPTKREQSVLYLGRLDPKKGLELLLQAMARLPGVRLNIAGDGNPGYVAELKTLVDALQLTDRVVFLGHLEGDRRWKLYRQSAVFVLPSLSENFANTVLEAMSAACPVVVTPGVGMAETVVHRKCGRVVPRESDEIAKVIQELLSRPGEREDMGRRGTEAAKSFTWASVAEQMLTNYRELAGSTLTKRRVEGTAG